jgi:tRNA (guanine37-N1)-methyltransferase
VVVETVTRLVPGVLGNPVSAELDSFSDGLLEHPCYTRPRSFRGRLVPEVLVSGDHGAVATWRRAQALRLTFERRPDLLRAVRLSDEDRRVLREVEDERG